MKIKTYVLPLVIIVVLFGGIAVTKAFGLWKTESTKVPSTIKSGEAMGEYNPSDIRGSYTFKDISSSFKIPVEILGEAFAIKSSDLNSFKVKDLETIYGSLKDSGTEIGTSSVRMFVAYYLSIPYEITGEESYLPKAAVDILKSKVKLSDERLKYLDSHSVEIK
ncbi:hypothetical protein [Clostridium sp.]|uniref:hypothetical protein n=1 Tax=Clostridium sp. TaxID=1506 RepID=UPI001A56BD39|nr:hypothetical protein [Clostridium sp.]MBK5240008.1 hypothetical protein [Clostridium sp.]